MSVLVIFLAASFAFQVASAQQCILNPPSGLFFTDITSCSATLHWKGSSGIHGYVVKYKLNNAVTWSANISVGTDTFYTFTNLDAGEKYNFGVRAICTDGSKSPLIKRSTTTEICSTPSDIHLTEQSATSATIGFTLPCGTDTVYYRYRNLSGGWYTSFVLNSTSITLLNLNPDSVYLYQLSSCPLNLHRWSVIDTIQFHRPNILFIVLDDALYNTYSCTGGPDFFQSPNIDRIANEGVRFQNNFVVLSYCSPSRASMLTGLYPHKTGVIDNGYYLDSSATTVATILHDAGYYTGLIGKYISWWPEPGYDYWMAAQTDYINDRYNCNGIAKSIPGHNTDVVTDTTLAFIERSPQPFYVWVAYHAPHDSAIPQPQYNGIYANDTMPLPDNMQPYTINYPSFLDNLSPSYYVTPSEVTSKYEAYFETLKGADDAIGTILNKLEDMNILDNTLIIFTSDNGHLFGEHGLFLKRLAYDPSIRVPMFIRYPKWWPNPVTVENQMSLNIDVASTIIEAAGIQDTFGFDGISLKKLADNTATRSDMLYESFYTNSAPAYPIPSIRAVRSLDYKYIYYGCNDNTVEEFFDLINDPEENVNQINNSDYSSLIQTYRNRLLDLQIQYQDTSVDQTMNCYLANPQFMREISSDTTAREVRVYPNPSDGELKIFVPYSGSYSIQIANETGQIFFSRQLDQHLAELNLGGLACGIYSVIYQSAGRTQTTKILVR